MQMPSKVIFFSFSFSFETIILYYIILLGQIRFSKTDKNNDPILTKMVQIMMESSKCY